MLATCWRRSGPVCKPVTHGSKHLDGYESLMASMMPSWSACDLRLMLARFHVDGMLGKPLAAETLTGLLGHSPRRYQDFAAQLVVSWQ